MGARERGCGVVKLAKAVEKWREQGKRVALVFVVLTSGSSPRPVGSMMAVSSEGDIEGSISAGCSEGAIVREALSFLAENRDASKVVKLSSEAAQGADSPFAVSAPCGGELEVLVVPYDDEVHGLMMRCSRTGERFAYIAVLGDGPLQGAEAVVAHDGVAQAWMDSALLDESLDRISWNGNRHAKSPYEGDVSNPSKAFDDGHAGVFDIMGQRVFACRYDARPRLVCIGAVHISACLASMAQAAGYSVTVIDPRAAFLAPDRFPEDVELVRAWPQEAFARMDISPETAICVLTHDAKIDEPALACALETDAFYIGCLGSAKTLGKRAKSLVAQGVDPAQFRRVHGPIGLYIGGRTPGEIAVSVLAQIQSVRHGRQAFPEAMPGRTLDEFAREEAGA